MDAAVLQAVGQVAGIGGLALGVFLLLFREIIRKKIFPMLPPAQAYRLLRLITGAVWSIALAGIAAWVYTSQASAKAVSADHGIAIGGDVSGGSTVENTTAVDPAK
ncbi:hypothetical protein [Mesorhizobium amorphae]|nr:hypothetical protein [Mesorhizobium amorphae]GLR44025.1 hypothetical protein GCM10007880_45420 [Mesorhizobium amorphae]